MKKALSKVFTFVLYFLVIILIAIVAYSLYCNSVRKVPSFFGYSVLRIVSNSMADKFKAGDYIVVKKTSVSNLKVSDIITFYSSDPNLNGAPNTHRIIKFTDQGILTKGDANPSADKYMVSNSAIIGKYQGKLSFGLIAKIISNQWLFLVVIILPVLVLMFFEIKKIAKIKAENDE